MEELWICVFITRAHTASKITLEHFFFHFDASASLQCQVILLTSLTIIQTHFSRLSNQSIYQRLLDLTCSGEVVQTPQALHPFAHLDH